MRKNEELIDALKKKVQNNNDSHATACSCTDSSYNYVRVENVTPLKPYKPYGVGEPYFYTPYIPAPVDEGVISTTASTIMIDDEVNSESEMVNHPKHYNQYDVEVIEMMRRIWGDKAVITFCKLNAFKYRMRMGEKDEISQDYEKEQWYLNYMKTIEMENIPLSPKEKPTDNIY